MSGAIVSAGVLIAWAIYWGLSNVADAIRETKPNAATDEQHSNAVLMQSYMRKSMMDAFALYKELLAQGCPRELARSVLPCSTYSRMFATVDLHNLFHFLRLRLHEHAQKEIRVYAEAMLELVEPIVPFAVAAFKETL